MSNGREASIRARLRNLADRGDQFELILTRYLLERFLYRLSVSDVAEQFCLKGALLFDLWFEDPHRPTRDADFLGNGPANAGRLADCIRTVCLIRCDDGVTYDPDTVTVQAIRDAADYGGLRVRLLGHLGKTRNRIQLDVGYGDIVTPAAEVEIMPVQLDDMPAPQLRVYSRASVVAEKLQALVFLGLGNSRMKDYYDLYKLTQHENIDPETLTAAIAVTFRRRLTSIPDDVPIGLQDEFAHDRDKQIQWQAFLDKNGLDDLALDEVVRTLREILMTPLQQARQSNR